MCVHVCVCERESVCVCLSVYVCVCVDQMPTEPERQHCS